MNLTNDVNVVIDEIEKVIDDSTMLGAAWDCLSESAKDKIRQKLKVIIESNCD